MKSRGAWIAAGMLGVLVVGVVVIHGRARDFLEGGDFQKLVERHAGAAFRGEARLAPIRWSGPGAFSESMAVRGGPDSGFETMEAAHLRGEWNWRAVFSGAWRVEEATVESLRGRFGPPSGLGTGFAESEAGRGAGWWAAFLPKRFELGRATIRRVDWDFGEVGLRDSALEIRPEGGVWNFSGTGGTLAIPHWPSLGVESYRAAWGGDRLRIAAASLRAGSKGRIAASGDWPGRLDVEWDGVELPEVVPVPWKGMANGTISGTAGIDADGAAGSFEVSNAAIRGAEWLEELASITGRAEFRRLPIHKATGGFEYRAGVWRWNDLVLESGGLLRIEGSVRVSADRSLSGEVMLGVAPALLGSLPGAREKVFTETRDGFAWTPVEIGGTLDEPSENLGARVAAAAGGTVLEAVHPVLQKVPEGAGKALGDTINTLFDILGR